MEKQMRKRIEKTELIEEEEPLSAYRSLGEWDDADEREEINAFEEDDDGGRRRDPLRKH